MCKCISINVCTEEERDDALDKMHTVKLQVYKILKHIETLTKSLDNLIIFINKPRNRSLVNHKGENKRHDESKNVLFFFSVKGRSMLCIPHG